MPDFKPIWARFKPIGPDWLKARADWLKAGTDLLKAGNLGPIQVQLGSNWGEPRPNPCPTQVNPGSTEVNPGPTQVQPRSHTAATAVGVAVGLLGGRAFVAAT